MEKTDSFLDKIKEASLRYAGIGYLVGDSSIIARGIVTKNKATAVTGLAWGSGGIGLSLFGKKPADYQLKELSLGLAEHLENDNVDIPPSSTLHQDYLSKPDQIPNKVQKFFYDHPTEILNTVYALGAVALMAGGSKVVNGKKDWGDVMSGALVLGGALSGLFIKEKKLGTNEDGTPKKPENLVEWVREKPLRVSAAMYTVNGVPTLLKAMQEQRTGGHKATYMLKYMQVGAFLGANALLSMSSKDSDNNANDLPKDEFLKHASNVVEVQPESKRAQVAESVANYIAQDERFEMSKEDALNLLLKTEQNQALPTANIRTASHQGALAESPLQTQVI